MQLLDQFVSVENPEKKLPNPEKIDWGFVSAKNSHVEQPTDLHQLAQGLGVLARDGRGSGPGESRSPFDGSPDEPGQILEALPIYAKWFKFNAAHKIERQSLPEFFGEKPSKNPTVYLKIRNFIVQAYWRTPASYLTATACRRCISGDAPAVLRVHAFLESWGIINLFAAPSSQAGLAKEPNHLPAFTTSTDRGSRTEPSASKEVLGTVLRRLAEDDRSIPQRCFQCQCHIGRAWLSLRPFKDRPEKPNIAICEDCFSHSRYPIFFGPENWQRESVDQSPSGPETPLVRVSIDDQCRLIEGLKDWSDESVPNPQSLVSRLPGVGAKEARLLLAQVPVEEADSVLTEQLKGIRPPGHSYAQFMGETFEQRLVEIGESCGATAKENGRALIGEQQAQQRILERQKHLSELFNAKAEKVSVRLKFFEEAERIIYHERQNLNLL